MTSWLPAIQYPPSGSGYWAPVTATLNWCEEDYYGSFYVAEIVNTLTNIWFMYLAYLGIQSCRRNGHDTIFLVTYVGYLLVGTGSFCFHASLTYPMQLVDELSMIYTTCLMCYATFSYSKSRLYSFVLALGLVSLALFITLYYHYLQDPAFHQNAYAILTAVVLARSLYVMEFSLRPSLTKKEEEFKLHRKRSMSVNEKEASRSGDRRDARILRTMWVMIATGLSIFLGGFLIWSLDNQYCPTLRLWRRQVGLPWGVLLEGHGWWHLMTGLGAYFYITWGIWLRHCLNGRQDEFELAWPSIFSLPETVRSRSSNDSRNSNGSKKLR